MSHSSGTGSRSGIAGLIGRVWAASHGAAAFADEIGIGQHTPRREPVQEDWDLTVRAGRLRFAGRPADWPPVMQKELVPVIVKGVIPAVNTWALFLGNETKTFVIYVEPFLGKAIQMTLAGVKKERPLTHDLIGSILLGLGARLDHVIVNDARETTFFARIFIRMDNELGKKIVEIDARPSDSIVLALQQKRPIFVARAVFDAVEDSSEIFERELKQQSEDEERSGLDETA